MAEYEAHKGGRTEKSLKDISIEKCGFYLPECAYYDFINDAPDDANKATVVQYMVEVLNPKAGDKKFLDSACDSGGMFVQAARYMHKHNADVDAGMQFRCYGVEKEPDTVKLAKMNLLLNNVRGDITEANSFYLDPYSAFGAFDYVMANPPFNVDEVVVEKVIDDSRFNTHGVPRQIPYFYQKSP